MSCASNTSPQAEQCLPPVSPVVEQVGAIASSITSVCPSASTISCATKISPQTEQCLPSVRPVLVQVGATASVVASVCLRQTIPSEQTISVARIVKFHELLSGMVFHCSLVPSKMIFVR